MAQRDIPEWQVHEWDSEVLRLLLIDRSMSAANGRDTNIIWATDEYARNCPNDESFAFGHQITADLIANRDKPRVICPRVDKRLDEQRRRSVDKAEVFTPSWICNRQNNLVDEAWFGRKTRLFNYEPKIPPATGLRWKSVTGRKIDFPPEDGRSWRDYVRASRLEMACGEGPYLTSRYDTVSGVWIEPPNRIGILDRKLRVVGENASRSEWFLWAETALQNCYGFEWQGDNVLLARENMLFAVMESYLSRFGSKAKPMPMDWIRRCAEIISWNIWQMDGIKFVVPGSCHDVACEPRDQMLPGFSEQCPDELLLATPCPGCAKNDVMRHNGVRCRIMDWETGKPVLFLPPFTFEPIKETC